MAVTLSKPIKRGEKEITQVSLREPTAGELRGLDNFDIMRMNVTAHRSLIPRISELTANEFDQLPPKDLIAIQSEVVSFFTGTE
jgi:hypothetical protein